MDRMIYLSMSGAKAAMQRQEVLANNLVYWLTPEAPAALPPRGGTASGPAKPDPRRSLGNA